MEVRVVTFNPGKGAVFIDVERALDRREQAVLCRIKSNRLREQAAGRGRFAKSNVHWPSNTDCADGAASSALAIIAPQHSTHDMPAAARKSRMIRFIDRAWQHSVVMAAPDWSWLRWAFSATHRLPNIFELTHGFAPLSSIASDEVLVTSTRQRLLRPG
jgi:hypothetical protein